MDGKQPGDPVKAAKAMYELAQSSEPPLRLVLGSDAHGVSSLDLDDGVTHRGVDRF